MPIVQALEVQTRSGPKLIKLEDGDVIGGLAVHRTIMAPSTWTITHAQSGHAVLTGLAEQEAARAAATRLLPLVDWTKVTATGFPSNAARERLKREVHLIQQKLAN